MRRRPPFPLLAVALLVLGSGCGNSAENRPDVVGSQPGPGASLPGTVREIRVTFDQEIAILNPSALQLATSFGFAPIEALPDPDDPRSILIRTGSNSFFPPGDNILTVGAGLVANGEQHYALNPTTISFRLGTAPGAFDAYLASADLQAVVSFDADTLLPKSSVPTPGGAVPAGLAGIQVDGDAQLYVQFTTGGGTGEAIARFHPGEGAMTPVTLTQTAGAGADLTADYPLIVLSSDGTQVLAAFRDEEAQAVRLAAIDGVTGVEVQSILLSPTPSPSTRPVGLTVGSDGLIHVACFAPGMDRFVEVDEATFVEIDLGPDPGVDGLPLPDGAGPVVPSGSQRYLAPVSAATANMVRIRPSDGNILLDTDPTIGAPNALGITFAGGRIVLGLAGYVPLDGVVQRDQEAFTTTATAEAVIDELGGMSSGATTVDCLGFDRIGSRIFVALDTDVLAAFNYGMVALDLRPDLEDTDALDLSLDAPGTVAIAFIPPSTIPEGCVPCGP